MTARLKESKDDMRGLEVAQTYRKNGKVCQEIIVWGNRKLEREQLEGEGRKYKGKVKER